MPSNFPISRSFGAALFGIDARLVEVQAAEAFGLPRAAIVGRAESEVREARERVKVALQARGLWPREGEQAVVINLAPANLRKAGTGLDLPMCLAVAALRRAPLRAALDRVLAYGEVGLDGRIRPAHGSLSAAMAARDAGLDSVMVPPEAAREAAEVSGVETLAVESLDRAVEVLLGNGAALSPWPKAPPPRRSSGIDLTDVKGQSSARRAIEVAAAGGHNLLLIGPPGAGKTLLARRLPTVLPPMTREESIEATRVHSAAGRISPGGGLLLERPFRAPHHSVSPAGLVGGGSVPRPGEVSLATHGVLFLDELLEFPRHVLEVLRQPLEDGRVTVVRASGRAVFPARFVMVGAMNPCPCGWLGSSRRPCECTPGMIDRYRSRLSGPLLDRIDLHVDVPAVTAAELGRSSSGESSATVRERVEGARRIQLERNRRFEATCNAYLAGRDLADACPLSTAAAAALETAMESLGLSARAHHRILKVARTLADLAGRGSIETSDVGEAVRYRTLDRPVA